LSDVVTLAEVTGHEYALTVDVGTLGEVEDSTVERLERKTLVFREGVINYYFNEMK
jgi:hypothetical protein